MSDEDDFVDGEIVNTVMTKDSLSKIWWRTREGEFIYIKDMEDKHIRNSALFLMGLEYSDCVAPEEVKVMWLRVFSMEWARRMSRRRIKGLSVIVYRGDALIDKL